MVVPLSLRTRTPVRSKLGSTPEARSAAQTITSGHAFPSFLPVADPCACPSPGPQADSPGSSSWSLVMGSEGNQRRRPD